MYNLLLFHVINKEVGCGEADFWSWGTNAICTGTNRDILHVQGCFLSELDGSASPP